MGYTRTAARAFDEVRTKRFLSASASPAESKAHQVWIERNVDVHSLSSLVRQPFQRVNCIVGLLLAAPTNQQDAPGCMCLAKLYPRFMGAFAAPMIVVFDRVVGAHVDALNMRGQNAFPPSQIIALVLRAGQLVSLI